VPSWAEFLRAVEYALPALEIVDSAIADWKITLVDTVADNASSALYVLGDQPVSIGRLQLAQLPMTMTRGDAIASQGIGAACLGHPLRAAWWLARTMAECGQPMRAGEVVMSGALGPMVPAAAGDVFVADLGPLGTVSCRMA
jgi:2-keto-4-pentenoate hydratase